MDYLRSALEKIKAVAGNGVEVNPRPALLALSDFPGLRYVIEVAEDVDIFDADDELWAMQTRNQGDVDKVCIPVIRYQQPAPVQPDHTGSRRLKKKRYSTARYLSI